MEKTGISQSIVIVSGLPRSGTSMIMQMLEAGGLPVLTDGRRVPDENNPKGYYEFETIKQLVDDQSWIAQAVGKAVKIIAQFLPFLPEGFNYKIFFVHRPLEEVLKSQNRMLISYNKPLGKLPAGKIIAFFQKTILQATDWANSSANVQMLHLNYPEILSHPLASAGLVKTFLDADLDVAKMAGVINQSLRHIKN